MARPQRKPDRNAAINRARELRRSPTLPEGLLWQALRGRPEGLKFRRQHPFDHFTVDFYCPAARLVVEVDGDSHSMGDRPARDEARDAWLHRHGLRVMRIDAADVMKDVGSAVRAILVAVRG